MFCIECAMQKRSHAIENEILIQLMREAREEAGLSQFDLASALDWTAEKVSAVESGEHRLDAVELWHWLRALGRDLPVFAETLERRIEAYAGGSAMSGRKRGRGEER